MPNKRPRTIAAYIRTAPPAARPHLRRLHAILKRAAPHAEEKIKWGTPFFVEPRFLFAFSAHKAHVSLAPSRAALDAFRKELRKHDTTRYLLRIPYTDPVPDALVRKIARHRVRELRIRKDTAFW